MKSLFSKKIKIVFLLVVVSLFILAVGCTDKPKESVNTALPKQEEPKESSPNSEPAADTNKYLKLLSIEEVEKIGNFKDVKLVDKDPSKGAGGELNFAVEDEVILIIQVQGGSFYNSLKSTSFYKEDLSGLGDEAFWGSSGVTDSLNGLTFRLGDKAVSVVGFYDMGAEIKPYLNQDQLLEIANLILPRL